MHSPATSTPPACDLFAFDLYEAERRSSLSRSTLRRAIDAGELKAVRVGTAIYTQDDNQLNQCEAILACSLHGRVSHIKF